MRIFYNRTFGHPKVLEDCADRLTPTRGYVYIGINDTCNNILVPIKKI